MKNKYAIRNAFLVLLVLIIVLNVFILIEFLLIVNANKISMHQMKTQIVLNKDAQKNNTLIKFADVNYTLIKIKSIFFLNYYLI